MTTLFRARRSYARCPSNPFMALSRRSDRLDRAASTIAFALLIASWAVAYVAIVPADPAPAHRVHIVATR